MKKFVQFFIFILLFYSCSSNRIQKIQNFEPLKLELKGEKKFSNQNKSEIKITNYVKNKNIEKVIQEASQYFGTPFRLGGMNKRGIDCSALMCVAFKSVGINLNRTAHTMAKQAREVPLNEVKIGDLLFFRTTSKRRIGHVGLVVQVTPKSIKFIHSSTSRGVIISDLYEIYWTEAFDKVGRIWD